MGHWHDKDLSVSFSVHSMLAEKKQYFSICNREGGIAVFTELCDGVVYRHAIFAPLEAGPYKGMDGAMDIAHPPVWRRRNRRGRFTVKERIFGTEE